MPSVTSKSGTIKALKDSSWQEITNIPYDLSGVSEIKCDSIDSWFRITVAEGHIIHFADALPAASRCVISEGSYYYYPRR